MSYSGVRNFGCRVTTDATLAGLGVVILENELLRVTILADKGSDVYEFLYKPLDVDFMWRAPNGLRRPGVTVPSAGRWPEATQVAWESVSTQSRGASLTIGGPADTATVGWPQGAFFPRLEV